MYFRQFLLLEQFFEFICEKEHDSFLPSTLSSSSSNLPTTMNHRRLFAHPSLSFNAVDGIHFPKRADDCKFLPVNQY